MLPGVAYHVTQRGVNHEQVFYCEQDRRTYLGLVQTQFKDSGARLLGWCLMTNHVHWVIVPDREDTLAVLFRRVHGRYAQYLNARRQRTGHLWQNRFFSCPIAEESLGTVLRYVELNPVRAEMVDAADRYLWSSASAHLKGPGHEVVALLDWTYWRDSGGHEEWHRLLGTVEELQKVQKLRRATYAGAPFGPAEFVRKLEDRFGRQWLRPGRPKRVPMAVEKGTERSGAVSAA